MVKIKRINSIHNLGVYKNYTRQGNISDFNDKNIIYGWNYSGKTTISRLFNWLNIGSVIDPDYDEATFEIELHDGTKISQETRKTSPCVVQVFNSDFIAANLQFTSFDTSKIKAIAFDLGDETKPIRNRIQWLNNRILNNEFILQSTNLYSSQYSNFESLFTERARGIKNTFFNSTIEFTKAHLKRIIETMSQDTYRNYIITNTKELIGYQSNALEKDAKPTIEFTRPILSFDSLIEDIEAILASSPKDIIQDDVLSTNQDLYDWVRSGLYLHTHVHSLTNCAFCGQPLSSPRIDYLNQYYSNEAAKIKEAGQVLIMRIKEEQRLNQFSAWIKLSDLAFTGDLGSQFQNLKLEYDTIASNYTSLLDELIKIIQNKLDSNLFISLPLPEINTIYKDNLENWICRVETIIKSHNENVRNFNQLKNRAIDKCKKHLVATILDEIDYYKVLHKAKKEEQFHTLLTTINNSILKEIQELETHIKSIAKGKEVCNQYIKLLLHRDDIKIETTEDGYFILKRANKIAKYLSEGEKSAISFAYFLVLLESDIEKLKKSIIVIDDPISSLDGNHIALVSSLINSFFFKKGIDPEKPDKVIDCFSQLFILTHNFEFYNFIQDANNIKRKKKEVNKDGDSQDVPALNKFLIKRINETESTIVNMPKALGTYKSEYVYLWSQIIDYKEKGCPEELNYIMPNIVRRFLEIYTLIKLPGNHNEIDNRVKILINDVNELKILHNFSHFTSLDRVVRHSEIIMRMPDIIDDIYTLVQKDEMHFNSLNEGIQKR